MAVTGEKYTSALESLKERVAFPPAGGELLKSWSSAEQHRGVVFRATIWADSGDSDGRIVRLSSMNRTGTIETEVESVVVNGVIDPDSCGSAVSEYFRPGPSEELESWMEDEFRRASRSELLNGLRGALRPLRHHGDLSLGVISELGRHGFRPVGFQVPPPGDEWDDEYFLRSSEPYFAIVDEVISHLISKVDHGTGSVVDISFSIVEALARGGMYFPEEYWEDNGGTDYDDDEAWKIIT